MAEFLTMLTLWVLLGLYYAYVGYVLWRTEPAKSSPVIDPAIRGEIEQTMEWWDGEFRALVDKTDPDARLYRESKSVYSHLSYVGRPRGAAPVYRSVKGRTYTHTHGNRGTDPACEACQAYLSDLEKTRAYLKPYRPDVSAVMKKEYR